MKTESLVSIIVPIYNVEQYLACCLDSVISQTYRNIEILLIDDGSTDTSGMIAETYGVKDSRIRVFHTANNGVSHARNVGLDAMTGKYCLLLDSDDALHKDAVARSVRLMEHEDLDCVIYKYQTVEDNKFENTIHKIERQKNSELYVYYAHDELMREILTGQRFRMLACNKLYKASLWTNIRYPIGRKFGDDTFVTYQLMDRCTRGGYIEDVLYFYRQREGSALHSKLSIDNLQLFHSYTELLTYYSDNAYGLLDEAYYAYVIRMFDFFARVNNSDLTEQERRRLLEALRRISKPYRKRLCSCTKATYKQRLLLNAFFLSPDIFSKLI